MKIIFIRHGEPNYEIDSLTEKGWREAMAGAPYGGDSQTMAVLLEK